jgi:hypothetical protein
MAPKASHGQATLPTTAEYDMVTDLALQLIAELETISYALHNVVGPWMDEGRYLVEPDFAALGELWSFIEDMETDAAEITDEVGRIGEWLQQLSAMRSQLAYDAKIAKLVEGGES